MSLPKFMKEAIAQYVPILEGGDWGDPQRPYELADVVLESRPKVVVEIGTFGGASALPMAFALRQNNNGGKLYCIDPWRVEYAQEGEWEDNKKWWKENISIGDIHQKCMDAFWAHNLDEWVVVIRAASQHCHQLFTDISVLLIDGNHSEVASLRDAQLYVPKVISGGYIFADDVAWQVKEGEQFVNSTQKEIAFIEESCDLVKQIGGMRLYRKR